MQQKQPRSGGMVLDRRVSAGCEWERNQAASAATALTTQSLKAMYLSLSAALYPASGPIAAHQFVRPAEKTFSAGAFPRGRNTTFPEEIRYMKPAGVPVSTALPVASTW